MGIARRLSFFRVFVVVGVTIFSPAAAFSQQAAAPAQPTLSASDMEAFLLKARITRQRDTGTGVTASKRATLSDGTLTHDAHIQTVDIAQSVFQAGKSSEVNFKDTFRYNIAGYRVAQLIGLSTVPMSVARSVDGKNAAVTWWVDDVQMDEKARLAKKTFGPNPDRTSKQIQIMRVFDELIQNKDRNQGNILWTSDWAMWLIDHTRAFRLGKELLKPENLTRCDRGLLDRLRGITPEALAAAVGDSLNRLEQEALLARRDLIVKHYESRIAKLGEAVVLFEINASSSQTARSTPVP
jgi:hypothetical protein